MARGLGRVRDHEDGLAVVVDLVEQAQQLVRRAGVERARGLVGQHQLRVRDERARHGGALLLSAGDLVGVFGEDVRDAQLLRDGLQARAHLGVGFLRQHEREEDVVLDGEGVEEVEVLEHEAQVVAAERADLALGDGREAAAVQQHLARGRAVERREDVEKRGLAGAGLAHDGDVFALLDGERDVRERLHLAAAEAGGIDLFEVVDFQNRHGFLLT